MSGAGVEGSRRCEAGGEHSIRLPTGPPRRKDALASSVNALEQLAQVVAEIERRIKE